ncbi:hypothetical protein [Paenibacillus sp. L3-i20]|uniref:hypothetical protein n=1 Tax=Paenibacillus sp. L3-i20 TaxID=2905833 RepID=UPI001EDF3633|nr:hypothetical protein [Paenibacillus sp. L3-i20]GKU79276.1 hypothetical protein L3i20_v236730 [Paenibacillus sp. L3-i20]
MHITENENLSSLICSTKNRLEILLGQQEKAMVEVAAAKLTAEKAQEALLHNLQESAIDKICALEAAIEAELFSA